MSESNERCFDCEVLKNYERDNTSFALGFFCPIKDSFVVRDDIACKWIVGDKLPF